MTPKLRTFFRSEAFSGIALACFVFGVYLATLAPSVSWEDGGEIATSLHTLSIVHPTGYPLFTLVGWVFSHFPIGGRVAWKLNLMVAVFCAVSVYFFYRTILHLLTETARKGKNPVATGLVRSSEDLSLRFAAAGAALSLAFSRTFWTEALAVEVYAFHLLLLSVAVYLFLRAVSERATDSGQRLWLGFAFVLGLGFTNHMMMVLPGPAFLYLYFRSHGFRKESWIKIGKAVPVFLLGLSPYLYLPLRAAQEPLMNWGDPTSFGRFWEHVTGAQFRYQMFSSWELPFEKAGDFFAKLPTETGYVPLFFWALGAWVLFRVNRRVGILTALLFFGCLLYGFNYGFDDRNYYLQAYFAGSIFGAFGLARMLLPQFARGPFAPSGNSRSSVAKASQAVPEGSGSRPLLRIAALALPLFPLTLNYSAVNKHGDYAAEDFARNTLESLDSGSIFLSQDEKFFLFPALYLQTVENFRTDVVVINQPLLQHPWYVRSMRRQHPEVFGKAAAEVDGFLLADSLHTAYVQRGGPDPSPELEGLRMEFFRTFQVLIEALFWKNYPQRPIAVSQSTGLSEKVQAVPKGLTFRLYALRDTVPKLAAPREFGIRPFVGEDRNLEDVRQEYGRAYTYQGVYRIVFEADTAGGVVLLNKALRIVPGFPLAAQWLAQLRR